MSAAPGPPWSRACPRSAPRRARRLRRGGALVSEHRLKNGLRVLVAERHADPVVAVMTFYAVGSRHEREHEAGVSHFLEHMMFKGSAGFGKGEVDRLTTALGGQNNAYTGNDHTAYWFELASDRWEHALAMEADRMQSLTLDPAEFDAEREVVLEELSMGEDDAWRVLGNHVERALFPRHSYGRPIIGYEDSLRRLTVEDMRDYYRRSYHPGNATMVVCGDVEPEAALRAVRKLLGKIPGGARGEAQPYRPPVDGPPGEHRLSLRWDDPAWRLCMAWPTSPVGTREDLALDLVSTVLTSGRASRLYRRLVQESGLAVSVSSYNDARVEGGVFWIFAECAQGADPRALEAALEEEFEDLRRRLVPAAELRRVKLTLRSSDAFGSESVSDVAEELGEFAVDADWRMALDGAERQLRITAAEMRATARRFLVPERRVLAWSAPEPARAARRG